MKTILIVEDNDLLRDNICEILRLEGYFVFAASNGQEGIDIAIQEHPDLIISDVNMPKKNGFEMLQELRSIDATKITPFIFLTVKNSMNDLRQGMNLGADDYIAKPFEMTELLKAVANRFTKRSAVLQNEIDKYDKLQDAVGKIITNVIDQPLKSIERLTGLLSSEAEILKPSDITEISKIIFKNAKDLRYEITHIVYYHRTVALKDQPKELEKYKKDFTQSAAAHIKQTTLNTAQNHRREQDLVMAINDQPVKIPSDFLSYITRELVDNAFKYSPMNTSVKVSATEVGEKYQIIIQDRGIGFPYENIDSYIPYIKEGEVETSTNGLGLSLVNVRNIVRLFDGDISVSSDTEVGTSFKISIPLA